MRQAAMSLRLLLAVVILATAVPIVRPAAAEDAVREALRERIERLREGGALTLAGARVAALRFVPTLYEQRRFRPAWSDPANVAALLQAIADSALDGLEPDDFLAAPLTELRAASAAEPADPGRRADLDILLTDALFRLGYQLYYGKVDPERLDPDWNLARAPFRGDPTRVVEEALAAGRIPALLDDLRPRHRYYRALKAALARYRAIAAAGGWASLPSGPWLKPGGSDPRIPALRRRLAAEGDGEAATEAEGTRYDGALEAAVRRFQESHGLDVDGIVGPATLSALNVPVEARVGQIRVNLERARWVLQGLADDFIVVNVAGFSAYFVHDGEIVWRSRAIVGRPYRKTPVFTADMTYLVFNPTWTVPPTILRKDVLPKIKADPAYLARNDFRLIDRNGRSVAPASVDWASLRARGFPYQIVQQPGPDNALGRVKFMFPNRHLVYLHDTPARELFERSQRTFSSGCVRLEKAYELAELLLADQPAWGRDWMEAVTASGKTTTVHLSRPLPVLLLYWTVDPGPDGGIRFLNDVYDRDRAILAALGARFVPRLPG